MDCAPVERHDHVRQDAAANSNQRRGQSDGQTIGQPEAPRNVLPQRRQLIAEYQPNGCEQRDRHEYGFEHYCGRVARQHSSANHAGDDRNTPQSQQIEIDGIRFAVAGERCDRGGDYQRQRCPGAERHPQLIWHTKHDKDLIEDGNHNGPSSDAEHTREETREAAGGNQYQPQEYQITHDDKLGPGKGMRDTLTRPRR